ncbi:DUF3953 domain-containing protein [Bacillus sp. V3]|nr:DUF3953 domain-containing protein [Bacillus sp. V3]
MPCRKRHLAGFHAFFHCRSPNISLCFFSYLSLAFLLWGIEQLKDKQLKTGYFYIVVAVFMSLNLIWLKIAT